MSSIQSQITWAEIDWAELDLDQMLDVIREQVAIAVVYSGDPDQEENVAARTRNPRPWKSYKGVAEQIASALHESNFRTVAIVEEGKELRTAIDTNHFQLYWLNTAGVQGRAPTSHASGLLESLGYPFVGHSPVQSAMLDDKVLLKQWLRGVGLPTSAFVVRAGGFGTTVSLTDPDYVQEFGSQFRGPFLIKPALGRGSVLVRVVDDFAKLNDHIFEISNKTHDRVLIEPFLSGQEFCVWSSGGLKVEHGKVVSRSKVLTFGHAERIFSSRDRIFLKKESGMSSIDPCRPLAERERQLKDDLTYVARFIHTALGLSFPIRVDLRMGDDGSLSILEVNPKPDLRMPENDNTSLISAALFDLGCNYSDFAVKILADFLDYQRRHSPSGLAMLAPLFSRYLSLAEPQSLLANATRWD